MITNTFTLFALSLVCAAIASILIDNARIYFGIILLIGAYHFMPGRDE